jgi:hypothetical protein
MKNKQPDSTQQSFKRKEQKLQITKGLLVEKKVQSSLLRSFAAIHQNERSKLLFKLDKQQDVLGSLSTHNKRSNASMEQKKKEHVDIQPLPPIPLNRRADKERICSRPYPMPLPRTNPTAAKMALKNAQYTQQKRQILDANRFIKYKLHNTNELSFSSVLSKLSHKYAKVSSKSIDKRMPLSSYLFSSSISNVSANKHTPFKHFDLNQMKTPSTSHTTTPKQSRSKLDFKNENEHEKNGLDASNKKSESNRSQTNGLSESNELAIAKDGDQLPCDVFVSKSVDECMVLLRNDDHDHNSFE